VFEKNPTQHMPIASMVKIMTLNLIFDEIENGNLSLDTDVTAGQNATSMGGSQAFLDTNATYKLSELIKSIVVASANDSCVACAEHIAGSGEEFVAKMNQKAADLGMENTNFVNCTGLPAPNGYSCAKDVAIMSRELFNHPIFFDFSKIWMFDFKHPSGRITQLSNTNKLLRGYEGCDGGKTGFTNEAMYCLSATAKRGSSRLISVVMGSQTSKERNAENSKLFNYGFANYETRPLVLKGSKVLNPVYVDGGKTNSVNLICQNDLYHFGKRSKAEITFESTVKTLKAPLKAGRAVGELIIKMDGAEIGRVNLLAETSVAKKSYLDIINDITGSW
jgi:D-alanyl-D-alanine carboxypeptidase (penicillin-binding protein 5/6)